MIEVGSRVQLISPDVGGGALVGAMGTVLSITTHYLGSYDIFEEEEDNREVDFLEFEVKLDQGRDVWGEWVEIYFCLDEEIILMEPRKPSGFATFVKRIEE